MVYFRSAHTLAKCENFHFFFRRSWFYAIRHEFAFCIEIVKIDGIVPQWCVDILGIIGVSSVRMHKMWSIHSNFNNKQPSKELEAKQERSKEMRIIYITNKKFIIYSTWFIWDSNGLVVVFFAHFLQYFLFWFLLCMANGIFIFRFIMQNWILIWLEKFQKTFAHFVIESKHF